MSALVVAFIAGVCIFCIKAEEDCPSTMPVRIGSACYRVQTDPLRFFDARDNCMKIAEGGSMTSVKLPEVMEKLEKIIYDFVLSKLEKAVWWIGIRTTDSDMSKSAQERTWVVDYYDSKFVQKDYKMWESEGGPDDKGFTCGVINGSNNFMVKPVDCGGPRAPVICMMKEGKKCKHNAAPYLHYGPYCIAAVNGGLEYRYIHGACTREGTPTPYVDDDMKKWVVLAAKNSFIGGGVFMNMRRVGNKFVDLADGSSPSDDMWEEGEPTKEYDCAGLAVQLDNSLKLKTMSCDFFASSLCFINTEGE